MFIGAVGAASLVAHKYWPRGYPYGEKEEWEERLEKLEKPSKKKKTTPPLRSRDDDAEQHYYDKRGRDRHRSMQDFRRRDEHEHDGLLLQHQHNVRGGSGRLLVRRLDRSDTEMATVGSRSPQPIGRRRSLAVDGGSGGRQRLEEQRGSSHPPHVPTHAGSAAAAAAADDGDDDDSACRVRRVRFIEERHGPAAMPTRLQQPATVRHHVVESSHYKKIAG
ncbi:hypothetical protein GGR56DRAFT_628121 [Xylariaceae sp. FL0804]|nr:hypothetical protein GGR56DRAFT_628121 [Xylariaceae sp. FL0804]